MRDCSHLKTLKGKKRLVYKSGENCKGVISASKLKKNSRNEIVSKARHEHAKQTFKNLNKNGPSGWMDACKEAKEELGYWPVPIKKGSEFYKLTKSIFESNKQKSPKKSPKTSPKKSPKKSPKRSSPKSTKKSPKTSPKKLPKKSPKRSSPKSTKKSPKRSSPKSTKKSSMIVIPHTPTYAKPVKNKEIGSVAPKASASKSGPPKKQKQSSYAPFLNKQNSYSPFVSKPSSYSPFVV